MNNFWTGFEKHAVELSTDFWRKYKSAMTHWDPREVVHFLADSKNQKELKKEYARESEERSDAWAARSPASYAKRMTLGGLLVGIPAALLAPNRTIGALIGGSLGAGMGAASAGYHNESVQEAKRVTGLPAKLRKAYHKAESEKTFSHELSGAVDSIQHTPTYDWNL